MARRFTQVKPDAFKDIQVEAGVITTSFDPANPILDRTKILCVTTGGINPTCKPSYTDYFEDLDNVPNGTMEGKQLDSWECGLATTIVDVTPAGVKLGLGAADIDSNDSTRITPRSTLKLSDFTPSIWWVGDRADGGFFAIQMLNALSTDGFSLQTTKKGKGTMSLNIMGHFSMNAIDTVPMNFYVVEGDDSSTSLILDKSSLAVEAGNTATITATTTPAGKTVTWQSLNTDVATVSSSGVVTGVGAGTTQIIASFTDNDVTYSAFCTVTVTGESEG